MPAKATPTRLVPLLSALLDRHLAPAVKYRDERQARLAQRVQALCEDHQRANGIPPTDEEVQRFVSAALTEDWCEERERGFVPPDPRLWSEFPWYYALSLLFQEIRVPICEERDALSKEYEHPGDPSGDAYALQRYLERVRLNEVAETSPLSRELARLDAEGFGTRLAAVLQQKFPDEMPAILDAARAENPATAATGTKPRRRRRQAPRKQRPLTPEQVEAMQLVGEHKGNIAAAAKQAGKSRQAMGKLYRKATRKLGEKAPKAKRIKTQKLPKDRRGQVAVEDRGEEE